MHNVQLCTISAAAAPQNYHAAYEKWKQRKTYFVYSYCAFDEV